MLRDCLLEDRQLRPRVNIRFFNVVKTAAADHGQDEVAAQIWQRKKAGSKRMPGESSRLHGHNRRTDTRVKHSRGGHTSDRHVAAAQPAGARLLRALTEKVKQRLHLAGRILEALSFLHLLVLVLRALGQNVLAHIHHFIDCQRSQIVGRIQLGLFACSTIATVVTGCCKEGTTASCLRE
jgi:hypothetical protein